LNDLPTRKLTPVAIKDFTYSNAFCKLYKYSISGTDSAHVSVSGTTFKYKTNFLEPRTLKFSIWVHAQGDGINGKSHKKEYKSSI
jgi:hypothetical protein